jgi:hypothetical protein
VQGEHCSLEQLLLHWHSHNHHSQCWQHNKVSNVVLTFYCSIRWQDSFCLQLLQAVQPD